MGAIIISPTRELATQIHSVLVSLLAFHGPSAANSRPPDEDEMVANENRPTFPPSTLKVVPQLLLGGSTTPAQDLSFFLKNSPNLLIATPGRLLELLSSPHVHCPQSSFEVLVMDEADRLLDLGFKDDLQRILQRLPKQRRTGLFSASVSEAVDQLIRVGLRNPVKITVKVKSASGAEDKKTPTALEMSYLVTSPAQKLPVLQELLSGLSPTPQKTIVYLSTCAAVDYFQHVLPILLDSFTIVPLHGKHPPNVRRKNFTKFADSVSPTLLLTTDVAARGLDIPLVDLVVQLDPPKDPKDFIHRCGRAGRAGRKGLAVTFLTPGRESEGYVPFLEVRKTPIKPLTKPEIDIDSVDTASVSSKIRTLVLADRAMHDKAQKAFVSWVQAYSKHTASSIFRVADLDWTEMGNAWGLLKLPKMPELKSWQGDKFLGVQLDWEGYSYKDKVREKQRKTEMELRAAGISPTLNTRPRAQTEAWSQKKETRAVRDERREKKLKRRERDKLEKMNDAERVQHSQLSEMIAKVRAQTIAEDHDDEWEGFAD